MFTEKLDELLLDNKSNRNTEAQLIGLRALIIKIHEEEVETLKTRLAGYEENGAPYPASTFEKASKQEGEE